LLDFPDATLLGIKYILTSKKYRSRVIGHVLDSVLKDIWETDYRKMSDKEQREYAKSAFNKIVQLITDPTIKNVIGQVHSRFDVSDIMDSRKILIIKLPQGKLGIEKTRLIGSFFVSVIHSAALKRSGNAPVFPFYCDEFHNFHGWREMLTGLRKFRVPLILATQFMGQLSPEVAAALEGSVETTVAFRVGVTDAKELSAGFDAKVSDLTTLQPYEAYVSTGPRTHHLRMEPPPERTYPGSPEAIRRRCREDYALPREVVERRIDTFVENT
jgi:hypothetical protein